MTAELPPFVERHGDPVPRPPLVLEQTSTVAFVLAADAHRLRATCDRVFNEPSGGATDYRPIGDRVVLTITTVALGRTASRKDALGVPRAAAGVADLGGTIAGLWIPMISRRTPGGARVEPQLSFFAPLVLTSSPRLLASFRELFGWPALPGHAASAPASAVDRAPYVLLAPAESEIAVVPSAGRPSSVPEEAELVRGGGEAPWLSALTTDDAVMPLFRKIGAARAAIVSSLRQMRDVVDSTRASIQEVLEVSAKLADVRNAHAIPGRWTLRVRGVAALPIARELGLDPDGHPVECAFTFDTDVALEGASTPWRSTTVVPRTRSLERSDVEAGRPRRIAILGGGFAALATAFALTEDPASRSRHDVTVYQMGWRLGGRDRLPKGASLFGFYGNVFSLMRRCYEELAAGRVASPAPPARLGASSLRSGDASELGRRSDHPVSRWQDVVVARTSIDLGTSGGDPWMLVLPANHAIPGDASPFPTLPDLVRSLVSEVPRLTDGVLSVNSMELPLKGVRALTTLIAAAGDAVRLSAPATEEKTVEETLSPEPVADARHAIAEWVTSRATEKEKLSRAFVRCDLSLAMLEGILRDRVLSRGLGAIDETDFETWLRTHGASSATMSSALLRGLLDLAVGGARIHGERPPVAAGAALGFVLRLFYAYKGAVRWELRHEAGDAIFAPLYECLARRGVRFEMFHRVHSLALSTDRTHVDRVVLGRQATPIDHERGYAPLVMPDRVWPPQPLFEQLAEGETLLSEGVDLEAPPPDWPDVEEIELRRGEGFDAVVLTLPPLALRTTCPALAEARPEWRTMLDGLEVADDERPGMGRTLFTRGTTASRMTATGSGFDNLYLAGDWIDTGLNVGGLEASAIAGLQVSRALSGHPSVVYGETEARSSARDPGYRVLSDCPTCRIEGGSVDWVNPRVAQGAVAESRCRFCGRHVIGARVAANGKEARTTATAKEMLERWAKDEGATDANAYCRSSFRGKGIDEVAAALLGRSLVETSFDPLRFLFPPAPSGAAAPTDPPANGDEEPLTIARAMASVFAANGPVGASDEAFLSAFLAMTGHPPLRRYDLRPWRPRELPSPRHPDALLEALVVLAAADRRRTGDEWRMLADYARAWDFSVERIEHIERTLDRSYASLARRLWLSLHAALAD